MRNATVAAIFICVIIMSIGAIPAFAGENPKPEKAASYEAMIDAFAAKCLFKTDLRHSNSRRLRNDAAVSCLKNSYWQQHKGELIQAMNKAGIVAKEYKVRYFLNKRFFDHVQDTNLDLKALHPLAALPETPPDGFAEMTLSEFSRYFSVPEALLAKQLHPEVTEPDPEQTLRRIASARSMSPETLYGDIR
jgi:hypothetical protein